VASRSDMVSTVGHRDFFVAVRRSASAGSYSLRSTIGASAGRRRTAKPDAAAQPKIIGIARITWTTNDIQDVGHDERKEAPMKMHTDFIRNECVLGRLIVAFSMVTPAH